VGTATARDAGTLEREGWTRRFTAIGPRLAECTSLYEQLGFEVRLEPAETLDAEFVTPACQGCAVTAAARTIYTRPPQTPTGVTAPGG
jgi:hypothetical protein